MAMLVRRGFIATAAGIILAASPFAFAQTRKTMASKTGYAPVNGLKLYYEIHGTGLTHYNVFSTPAVASAVTPFLDAPMPGVGAGS